MDAALASLLVCHSDESSEEELREPEVQAPRIRTLEHYFHVRQVRIREVEHIVHVPQTQETVTHVPELLTDVQEQRTLVAPIQTVERTADVSQASAGSLHEDPVGLSDGRNTVSRQLPRCSDAGIFEYVASSDAISGTVSQPSTPWDDTGFDEEAFVISGITSTSCSPSSS